MRIRTKAEILYKAKKNESDLLMQAFMLAEELSELFEKIETGFELTIHVNENKDKKYKIKIQSTKTYKRESREQALEKFRHFSIPDIPGPVTITARKKNYNKSILMQSSNPDEELCVLISSLNFSNCFFNDGWICWPAFISP